MESHFGWLIRVEDVWDIMMLYTCFLFFGPAGKQRKNQWIPWKNLNELILLCRNQETTRHGLLLWCLLGECSALHHRMLSCEDCWSTSMAGSLVSDQSLMMSKLIFFSQPAYQNLTWNLKHVKKKSGLPLMIFRNPFEHFAQVKTESSLNKWFSWKSQTIVWEGHQVYITTVNFIHPGKLTWQLKNNHVKMYLL